MFKTLAAGLEKGPMGPSAHSITALPASVSWASRDGGQDDPATYELDRVLTNILASAEASEAVISTVDQNEHGTALPQAGAAARASLEKGGESGRVGWENDRKEGRNETQDF
jgi:hypothetical protein